MRQRPSLKEIEKKYCEVCFVDFDRVVPRELDQGLEILVCTSCHITVHKCCYDFDASVTILDKHVSQFLCERCKVESKHPISCLVCYGQEGAMKPLLGSNEFVHVYCGLVHNEIDTVSYYPTISFRKSQQYEELTNICEICMKRNAYDQCAEESCRRKIHTYCAKKTYAAMAAQTDEPHGWNHYISTGNHGAFDISEEVIPFELLSEEVDSMLKPLTDAQIALPQAIGLKKKIYKQYTDELRGKRKSTKKLRRGGFSYVLCTLHQSIPYCICQGKEGDEMVQCECCFQWYHQTCIKFSNDNSEERFICNYCKVFYEFKKKAVDQVRGGRVQCDVSKVELPFKISFADCMWVMRVVDNRIRGGQASKMLRQLSKYPLKSSCMQLLIRQQNRPKLQGLGEEVMQLIAVSAVEGLRPRRVLELDASGRPVVLQENVNFNARLGRAIECVTGWGVPADSLKDVLAELQFKRRALTDQYEQIIELSKSEQPYQEVTILKQKAQAYHYQHILSKLQQNISIPYHTLLQTYQKIKENSEIPAYLREVFEAKINQLKPLVDALLTLISQNPENMVKILPLVQQIQALHIQPPREFLQLKAEKKFIQDLQLYYNKHHGLNSQELTIPQQIQQIIEWTTIKPSQELAEIVSCYRQVTDTTIWPQTQALVKQLSSIALEYEVKQIIKRKVVKQDKLFHMMENVKSGSLENNSQQVRAFVEKWVALKEKINVALELSLQAIEQYEDISDNLKIVKEACEGLEGLGLKIEDQSKNSLLAQLKSRKQELEQLQVLYTESQLQKNPLTISKLLATLPKTNSLVRLYISLKKQYSAHLNRYTNYMAKISERIELFKGDSKKQRKDQIKENNEKPSLGEIREFIEVLKQSQIDMSREIKELNMILGNTLEIASKVRKYCEEKNDLGKVTTLEELNTRRKQIDELRRKVLMVAELNLNTELVDLYHLEIQIRMKNALLTPNTDLEKIGFLLKVAEEENLTHDPMYITLKDRFETKNQRSKEVNQLKHIEQMLNTEASRDNSGNLATLANYRRGLHILDPSEITIRNSYIEDLVDKNKLLKNKIGNILAGRTKLDYQEVRPLYLEALKSPFAVPQLGKMTIEVNKTWEIIRKWKELNKNYTLAHPIFYEYQSSLFSVEQIENVRKQLKSNQEQISTLKFLVESFSQETRDQMQEIVDRLENNPIVKDTAICLAGQKHYLEYWIKLLALCRQSKHLVSYQKIKRLILDSYNLLQKTLKRGDQYSDLTQIILEIEKYLTNIKKHLKMYPKYVQGHSLVEGFIDLEDFYLDNEEEPDLAEIVPLYKPFEDMPKFRVRNLQRVQSRKEDVSLKRSYSKFDELRGDSEKQISLPAPSDSSEEALPQVVSDNERRKIKEIFLKNIKKNPELQKYGECENEVKMIENQIFGEWHNDIVKYFEMSDEFEKLFIKLISCPNISNKIIKKKFEFKFIQLLVNNLQKVDELENMIIAKNKQQQTEKNVKDIIPVAEPEPQPQPSFDSVSKIDELAREDLKKEMKMLKETRESKQSRHKKKKHHKHKDRSRSPQAKFSSDSEKDLPKYIETEYNKEEPKPSDKGDLTNPKISDSPLRYDPEEQELLKRQTIFPKGSILKIKTCEAQIQTRKRGRVEFSVDLFTDEEHKKLLELVDPGFNRLPIRKEKSQNQMLPYIQKSRKKYRFLVGWFQTVNPEHNEYLKELAEEAAEKKKVYGWQSQHIKVHMMAVRQLVRISKFNVPSRVTSRSAAETLKDNRMVFVIQYPERLYQVRDRYKAFENISCKNQEYEVNVPMPIIETRPINDYYHNYTVPTIQPLNKPIFKEQPEVVYETWGDLPPQMPPPPLPPQPQQQYGLPQRVNQLRIQFNFGNYSPIVSESEDNEEDNKEREDLATNLINAFDVSKVQPPQPLSRDKPQQYQGYYGGYAYQAQPQQQRPIQGDSRWGGYAQMGQAQSMPLNPMAGRYSGMSQAGIPQGQAPAMNQGMGGMFKNPMMGQRNPQMQGMNGQYYDPRYQGYQGYQQQ